MPPTAELLAAVYGELVDDPLGDDTVVREPWSLLHERSLAMGWLTDSGKRGTVTIDEVTGRVATRDASDVGSVGLWDVHDAGRGPQRGSAPEVALWVQVGIESARPDRPMPVQALLNCFEDVAARIGSLRVDAVQIVLPVQQHGAAMPRNTTMPSLASMAWFANRDPRLRTRIDVTLDGGVDTAIRSAAGSMQTWLRQAEQDVFTCDEISLTEHGELAHRPVFFDGLWDEPDHHRVTFRGTLATWSLDAVGWLAALMAEVSARHGVTTPLLFTAEK